MAYRDENRKKKGSAGSKYLSLLLILAVFAMLGWGVLHATQRVELTHTEEIEWQAYEPGLDPGTYVYLTVKEAEPWLFTQVTEEVSAGAGANKYRFKLYTEYGFSLCRDMKGRELLLEVSQLINDMTDLRSEKEWRQDFRDEVRAFAGDTAGQEIYGIVTTPAEGQELDYSYYLIGALGLTDVESLMGNESEVIREARERMEELKDRSIVEVYRNGRPSAKEVHDGWKTVPGPGRVWMILSAVPLLILILVQAVRRRKGHGKTKNDNRQKTGSSELKQREAMQRMTDSLEKTTREIPPVGTRVASAQGLLQLLEYASAVVPELRVLEQSDEVGERLRQCRDSRPEEVLQILEKLLSRSSEILKNINTGSIKERWNHLESYQLTCGWKAFRFFEEMSAGDESFIQIREMLTEQLISLEENS